MLRLRCQILLLCIVVVLWATPASAHVRTVTLSVVDGDSGHAVAFPTARIQGGSHSLGSEDGVIVLADAPLGTFTIEIAHISYANVFRSVPAGTRDLAVELTARPYWLEEIRVGAEFDGSLGSVLRSQVTVTADQAKSLPDPADDAFQMIRALPRVSSDDVGGMFRISGGESNETLVRVDGLPIQEFFHGREFGGISSVIPRSAVHSASLHAGGFSARYGGRLSGAIDIRLRTDGPEGFSGSIATDLISSRVSAEHHGDERSFLLSVREGYLDRVLNAVQSQADIDPSYRDLLARAVLLKGNARKLSFNYLRSEDHNFFDDGNVLHRFNDDYVAQYLWGSASYAPTARFSMEGVAYFGATRQMRELRAADHENQRDRRMGARVEALLAPSPANLFRVGLEVEREWAEYDWRSPSVLTIDDAGNPFVIPNYSERSEQRNVRVGLFTENEWTPADFLALNTGFRLTSDSRASTVRLDPRLSLAVDLGLGVVARGAWGRYEQASSIALEGDASVRLPYGRQELAEHRVLSLHRSFRQQRIGIEAYTKRYDQLNGIVARTNEGVVEWEVMTNGKARGVETFWEYRSSRTNFWASYVLSRATWSSERWTIPRSHDRLHELRFAITRQLQGGWQVGANYTFHSGHPHTEQLWSRDPETDKWVLHERLPQSSRLPAYHRLDVRVRRNFVFGGWNMAAYAEALNVTAHDNVLWYAWQFRNEPSGFTPVRTTRTGMPGLPSLGLEVRF